MLEVQDAVKKSVASFSTIFTSETFKDLRLEEVAISDDQKFWTVTLSYKNPDFEQELSAQREANSNPLSALGGFRTVSPRQYKKVTLRSSDGTLMSITNA